MKLEVSLLLVLANMHLSSENHLGRPVKAQLDDVLTNFAQTHEFHEAQLAVLQGSRLVYAEGRSPMTASKRRSTDPGFSAKNSLLPLLDLSKTITGVAVLQLIEQGYLTFDSLVFGEMGVLYFFEPDDNSSVDPRIYDITVEHLLRHCGGWDESVGPVLDPMMNKALRNLGYNVPDIAQETERGDLLDQYDIIQYMLHKPLQFPPGEHTAQSNFGYTVLGRVVEAMTGQDYEDYVKENILEPAGMWHTRLGSPHHPETFDKDLKTQYSGSRMPFERLVKSQAYKDLSPRLLDSTLGWYSNIYDVARFLTALYSKENILIRQVTLDYALQRNPMLARHHRHKWLTMGLMAHADGSMSLESGEAMLGANIFIYKEPIPGPFADNDLDRYIRETNTIIIFMGYTTKHNKHFYGLNDTILSLNLPQLTQNAYISELCDMELRAHEETQLLKAHLDEHHLVAFSNAMKLAGYFPSWQHGYVHEGRTRFLVTFHQATNPSQLQFHLLKSVSKSKIYRQVALHAKNDYQVTHAQLVQSGAHGNKMEQLVLMTRSPHPIFTMFNLNTNYAAYENQLPFHKLEGYQPKVQSVNRDQGELYVSYILQKPTGLNQPSLPDTRSFAQLSLDELVLKQENLHQSGFSVKYIDSYTDNVGETKFAVIFRQGLPENRFQPHVTHDDLLREAYENAMQGFLITMAAAYTSHGQLHYVIVWERP